jgi:hypothetical protein
VEVSAYESKVKFTQEQAMKAKRGGWVVNATPRLLYARERDPIPIVQGAG